MMAPQHVVLGDPQLRGWCALLQIFMTSFLCSTEASERRDSILLLCSPGPSALLHEWVPLMTCSLPLCGQLPHSLRAPTPCQGPSDPDPSAWGPQQGGRADRDPPGARPAGRGVLSPSPFLGAPPWGCEGEAAGLWSGGHIRPGEAKTPSAVGAQVSVEGLQARLGPQFTAQQEKEMAGAGKLCACVPSPSPC